MINLSLKMSQGYVSRLRQDIPCITYSFFIWFHVLIWQQSCKFAPLTPLQLLLWFNFVWYVLWSNINTRIFTFLESFLQETCTVSVRFKCNCQFWPKFVGLGNYERFKWDIYAWLYIIFSCWWNELSTKQ